MNNELKSKTELGLNGVKPIAIHLWLE